MDKPTLRWFLSIAFQRTFQRERFVSQVYWRLAEREQCEFHRQFLQVLAKKSERSANRYAVRLLRLSARLPLDKNTIATRFWRGLLVHCGSRWAMPWFEWLEQSDAALYLMVFRIHSLKLSIGATRQR